MNRSALKSRSIPILGIALCLSMSPSVGAQGIRIGDRLDDFRLLDSSGKPHSSQSHEGRILVLAFWSFKCPVSIAYDDRLAALKDKYLRHGIAVLAVNSNVNESADEVRRNAGARQLTIPVLMDTDGTLAEHLGATVNPSVYVFDRSGALQYRGALDNNKRPGEQGRIAYVEEALDALLLGGSVTRTETRAFGCTLKRH